MVFPVSVVRSCDSPALPLYNREPHHVTSDFIIIRIVFFYLILVFKEYNSVFFNKKKIITFLKT
jgi:hypothetical protein